MALMLGRVGNYLSKERRTARQIKGALTYPLFMMIFAVAITTFLMAFVLPRFAKIYAQRSATLPAPTKALIAMSDFLTHQYMYYGPVALALIVTLILWMRRSSGKRVLDWLKLNTPVLRTMFSQLYLTRIARTMATLLNAGVNLLDIIDICRGVTDNTYYARLWNQMERDVRAGKQISDTVFESKIIPPNVASMINAGERSGRLSQVMERVSEFSEQELDTAVKSATAYIEPIMIMGMGLLVGGIAMALLLPIFSMGKVLSGAH
jgi:type IV pilus assembly protein PilC